MRRHGGSRPLEYPARNHFWYNTMTAFRALLVAIFISLAIYTLFVGNSYGWNLLPVFFGDIAKMNWPGQFNLDFMYMLSLSALWTMWRNRFSPEGLGLGALALFGGSLFLSAYLLALTFKHRGDVKAILLGKNSGQA